MQFTLTIELGTTFHTEVDPQPQDVAYVMFLAAAALQAHGWCGKSEMPVANHLGYTVGKWEVRDAPEPEFDERRYDDFRMNERSR